MRKEYVWTDQAAIDDFLDQQEVGHLTTVDQEGWPRTVPVNFLWQGGRIFFHAGPRGKLERLRQNPKVAFAVTEPLGLLTSEITANPCKDTQLGLSVVVRGLARELKAPEEKLSVLNKIIAKYDPAALSLNSGGPRDPSGLADEPAFGGCVVVAIEVAELTARRQLLGGRPEKYRRAVAAHFQKRGQESGSERDMRTALLLNESFED